MVKHDYGDNLNTTMATSVDPNVRIIGKRMEMCESEEEAVSLMFKGTHAFVEAFSYGRILVGTHFKQQSQVLANTYILVSFHFEILHLTPIFQVYSN